MNSGAPDADFKQKTESAAMQCTGVILADSQLLRIRTEAGRKALSEGDACPMFDREASLQRLLKTFRIFFHEIIVASSDLTWILQEDVTAVTPIFPRDNPLSALHAGLFTASNPFTLVWRCDTPLVKPEIIRLLLEKTDTKFDAVVPNIAGAYEPYCAVYARRWLPAVELHLRRGRMDWDALFRKAKVRVVSEQALTRLDQNLISFVSVQTTDAPKRAEQ